MSHRTVEIISRNSRPLEPRPTDLSPRLEKLVGIQAVLFDVYGTLFISGSGDVGHAAANPTVDSLAAAMDACGMTGSQDPADVLEKYYQTIRNSHARSRQRGIEFPEVDILEIWRETLAVQTDGNLELTAFAVEFESRSNPVWPMPGVLPVLQKIGQSRLMGIVSNAQFFTLDLFEALLGQSRRQLGFLPELEVYSFELGHAKPGAAIFEKAAESLSNLGIPAEKVLYIGNDMLNDIGGAQRVGFRSALFAGDRRSLRLRKEDPRVDGVSPDIIVNSLAQILECLDEPGGMSE